MCSSESLPESLLLTLLESLLGPTEDGDERLLRRGGGGGPPTAMTAAPVALKALPDLVPKTGEGLPPVPGRGG